MFPADTEVQSASGEALSGQALSGQALSGEDTLAQIEERILRTVELVNSLRQERDAALRQVADARAASEQAEASNKILSEEILSLKAERQLVRSRLERLLGHIDQLN